MWEREQRLKGSCSGAKRRFNGLCSAEAQPLVSWCFPRAFGALLGSPPEAPPLHKFAVNHEGADCMNAGGRVGVMGAM